MLTPERQISFQTISGHLVFSVAEGKAILQGYEGRDMHLQIPAVLEDGSDRFPVEKIGPKAFFDNRYLKAVTIPAGVKSVGDWAFSHCPQLSRINMEEGPCALGKNLFDQDRKFRIFYLGSPEGDGGERKDTEDADREGYGGLLAACATVLDAPYLLQTTRENDTEWLARWDQRMLTILDSDDMEGYTEVVLCGEEDYGSSENRPDEYRQKKRWRKVRLCFLRLLYDKKLADANKIRLQDYLRSHTKGCESQETWLFLKNERSQDMEYLKLFTELGCVGRDNFDACIADLSGEHAQMMAYLLSWKTDHLPDEDPFDSFSL
ncbi:MAG: leucine-rich repeat domain-containing protein [Lachnospiraceae bacterium]|nr:leucine-rich repeat domain-containing protein [Lachnospiraceae bacterium]